jgi:hypothetical protein
MEESFSSSVVGESKMSSIKEFEELVSETRFCGHCIYFIINKKQWCLRLMRMESQLHEDGNHKAVVVGYRSSQFQTWAINEDESEFWAHVVPLKHKKKYKERFRRLDELNMKALFKDLVERAKNETEDMKGKTDE